MPYLQPATANYFGFQPSEDQAPPRIRVYLVSSTEAGNINIGDLVCLTTDKNTARAIVARADTMFTLGVAASRVLAGDGSTAADPRVLSTRTVAVYDDPNTIFYSGDTSSGVIGAGNHIGKSFQVACSGVTASSGSDASFRFRLVGLHPIENAWSTIAAATATTTGETRKLLLKPDFHLFNAGFGLGHVTT